VSDIPSFVVIARWNARAGEADAVFQALQMLVAETRNEPGCLEYRVHQAPGDPCRFLLYERYVDEEAYAAHGASEHFRVFALEDGIPRLETREREFYTAVV
jgi:quinol monooxygenase YgiN